MQRSGVEPHQFTGLKYVLLLLTIAVVMRIGPGTTLESISGSAQIAAAIAWSVAFAMVIFGVFSKYPGRRSRR